MNVLIIKLKISKICKSYFRYRFNNFLLCNIYLYKSIKYFSYRGKIDKK